MRCTGKVSKLWTPLEEAGGGGVAEPLRGIAGALRLARYSYYPCHRLAVNKFR